MVQLLVIGNISMWGYFIYRAVRNYFQLFTTKSWRNVHGVLLLSTVSTQSLVIVWEAAFGTCHFYQLVAPWVILLGVFFYLACFYLIVRRYAYEDGDMDLDKRWFSSSFL